MEITSKRRMRRYPFSIMGCFTVMACSGRFGRPLFVPEVIEIEPVLGCKACVVFKSVGEALDDFLESSFTILTWNVELVGERLA